MRVRNTHTRAGVPFALAMAGALLAALAMMVAADKGASALTNCTVSHDANDSEELAFLGLINNYRQSNGLGALTISTNLNRGAAWMTEDLATNSYFSHTDSLGRSAYQRAIDCGYPSGAGENLAAGGSWSSASAAFTAWQNSPGHNANMLGQYYQQIGIARYYKAGSQYGWYWATTFGALNDGTGGGGAGPTNTPTNTATSTPTRTPTPAGATNTPTPTVATNTPTAFPPTSTPTTVPTGGSSPSPTQALPTSTPTAAQGGGSQGSPTPPPLPTSTPTPLAPTASPTAAATSTPTAVPTSTPATTATAAPTSPGGSLALSPGANFVAWPNTDVSPAVAFAGTTTVSVVYEWDPATGEWKRYFPGLPAYLNNLKSLRQGGAYWIIASGKSNLTFGW